MEKFEIERDSGAALASICEEKSDYAPMSQSAYNKYLDTDTNDADKSSSRS